MDLGLVYIKTAKGQDEVVTRANRLPSRVRSVLVMVDGKASGEEVVENAAVLGDSVSFFSLLLEEGFIEPVLVPAGTQSGEAPVREPKKPPKELIQTVSHMITDILGPAGDSLTLRLEKSTSIEEFTKLVEQAREVVENTSGKFKAEKFMQGVLDKLPM